MLHPVALSCPALANNNNLSVICSLTELSKPTSKAKAGSTQAKILIRLMQIAIHFSDHALRPKIPFAADIV
jgi:hypothetical protein